MNDEKCVKEGELIDLKKRVGRLEENEREDFGARKELTLAIRLFAENNDKQAQSIDSQATAIIEMGKTLVKVNENLDSMKENLDTLNSENKAIKNDLCELKDKVNNQTQVKVSKINSRGVMIAAFITGGLGLISIIGAALLALL